MFNNKIALFYRIISKTILNLLIFIIHLLNINIYNMLKYVHVFKVIL